MNSSGDIKILLRKYIMNDINAADLQLLRGLMDERGDDEIRRALQNEWDTMQDVVPVDEHIYSKMFGEIERRTKDDRKSPLIGWGRGLMKYAAVALLVLLSALSAYLFMDNREMSALTANQVVVKTAEGERTTVTLPDGTTVRLNSKSQLDYKQDFGLKDRQVSFNGEGFFDVAHNVEKTFVVNTHFINVQVLGTKFNLYTYENKDQIEMALVKGHVKVTTNQQPYQTADVQPNQKIVFEKKTGRMQIVDTDNQLETAWMSHDLVFHAEPLQTVLDCIGRKFGVTIKTDKLFNLNDTYTGMFDETNIREIMQILSIHYGFDYQLKGNIVYVNRPK
jgi:ferric-dicitrate binding protein FerR (iron transport regulator)